MAQDGRASNQPSDPVTSSDGSTTSSTDGPRTETVRDYRGTGIMWTGFALVVALALLVVVALQNTHDVELEFLWLDTQLPLILILLITFGLAVVASELIGFVWRHRRRRRLRERDELKRLRRSN